MWFGRQVVDQLLVEADADDRAVGSDTAQEPVVPTAALTEPAPVACERHAGQHHDVGLVGPDRSHRLRIGVGHGDGDVARTQAHGERTQIRLAREGLEQHHHPRPLELGQRCDPLDDRHRALGVERCLPSDRAHRPAQHPRGLVRARHAADSSVGVVSESPAFDANQFRTVLGHFPTGVTIVSGVDGDQPVGFTIGSFTSVSLDPPLVGFLPQKDSATWEAMSRSGAFCVNILSRHQADLCWKFAKSGNESERFDDLTWHPGTTGSPIIGRAVAWIDCTVEDVIEMGDHYFVLGRVVALEADADHDGEGPFPLLFFRGTLGGFAAEG